MLSEILQTRTLCEKRNMMFSLLLLLLLEYYNSYSVLVNVFHNPINNFSGAYINPIRL